MKWLATCCLALLLTGPVLAQVTPPALPVPPGYPMPTKPVDLKELIPPLLEALKDNDTEVRTAAAGALASIGREAVAPLLKVFEDKDKDKDLRSSVAFVLGQMGVQAQDALPALTKALKEEDKDVRRKSAVAIQRIVKEISERGYGYGYGYPGGSSPPVFPGFPGTRPPGGVPVPAPAPLPAPPPERKKDE